MCESSRAVHTIGPATPRKLIVRPRLNRHGANCIVSVRFAVKTHRNSLRLKHNVHAVLCLPGARIPTCRIKGGKAANMPPFFRQAESAIPHPNEVDTGHCPARKVNVEGAVVVGILSAWGISAVADFLRLRVSVLPTREPILSPALFCYARTRPSVRRLARTPGAFESWPHLKRGR